MRGKCHAILNRQVVTRAQSLRQVVDRRNDYEVCEVASNILNM
jgi:hypothetical protein